MQFKFLPSVKEWTLTKLLFIIANIFFIVSALFSVYYYKERCLYIDSAFQIFKMLNSESFNFEAGRYGVFLTQIIPLLSIKFGLSLKSFLIITSFNFIVINYLVFLLCYFLVNEKSVAFIIPTTLIICVSFGFFYTITEVYQSIIFLIALYAWINTRFAEIKSIKIQFFNVTIAFLLFVQSFLCHPIALFPALFIVGYHIVYHNQFKKIDNLILIPLFLLVAFIKYTNTDASSYEGGYLKNFVNSPSLLFNLFGFFPAKYFIKRIFFDIYLIPLVFIIILDIHYLIQKKFKLLVFVTGSFFLFWTISVLTFYEGGDDIAMERAFASIALFAVIPFAKEVIFFNDKYKITKALAFIGIIGLGFFAIHKAGEIYKTRISYMRALLKSTKSDSNVKFIAVQNELSDIIRIPWAFGVESLMLSAIETPNDQRTIYLTSNKNDFSNIDLTTPDRLFAVPFWLEWPYSNLNKKYFNLKPCAYKWLSNNNFEESRKPRLIKNFDFNLLKGAVELSNNFIDSMHIGKKAFLLEPQNEFGLTFESTIGDITKANNPVFLVHLNLLSPTKLEKDELFLVISLKNNNQFIYLKTFDLSEKNVLNKWISISYKADPIVIDSKGIFKIFIWNPNHKTCYINKFTIDIYE